jgi:hypothetical protein
MSNKEPVESVDRLNQIKADISQWGSEMDNFPADMLDTLDGLDGLSDTADFALFDPSLDLPEGLDPTGKSIIFFPNDSPFDECPDFESLVENLDVKSEMTPEDCEFAENMMDLKFEEPKEDENGEIDINEISENFIEKPSLGIAEKFTQILDENPENLHENAEKFNEIFAPTLHVENLAQIHDENIENFVQLQDENFVEAQNENFHQTHDENVETFAQIYHENLPQIQNENFAETLDENAENFAETLDENVIQIPGENLEETAGENEEVIETCEIDMDDMIQLPILEPEECSGEPEECPGEPAKCPGEPEECPADFIQEECPADFIRDLVDIVEKEPEFTPSVYDNSSRDSIVKSIWSRSRRDSFNSNSRLPKKSYSIPTETFRKWTEELEKVGSNIFLPMSYSPMSPEFSEKGESPGYFPENEGYKKSEKGQLVTPPDTPPQSFSLRLEIEEEELRQMVLKRTITDSDLEEENLTEIKRPKIVAIESFDIPFKFEFEVRRHHSREHFIKRGVLLENITGLESSELFEEISKIVKGGKIRSIQKLENEKFLIVLNREDDRNKFIKAIKKEKRKVGWKIKTGNNNIYQEWHQDSQFIKYIF